MFGRNATAPNVGDSSGHSLQVVDIFPTIQGEGPSAGKPAIFIRLAGCNLKCHFCDTDFEGGAKMLTLSAILEEVDFFQLSDDKSLVVITGGEPLRQNIAPLLYNLIDSGHAVEIETAGTLMPGAMVEVLDHYAGGAVRIICSPKTAVIHNLVMRYCSDYKYITQEGDGFFEMGSPICNTQHKQGKKHTLFFPDEWNTVLYRMNTIWVQPMDEYRPVLDWYNRLLGRSAVMVPDLKKTLANHAYAIKIAQRYNYRISLQLHKILNLP